MSDVRKMLTELGKKDDPFLDSRLNSQGKTQPFFVFDHDHVMCRVTDYKVQLRVAVIQRLRALESGEATP